MEQLFLAAQKKLFLSATRLSIIQSDLSILLRHSPKWPTRRKLVLDFNTWAILENDVTKCLNLIGLSKEELWIGTTFSALREKVAPILDSLSHWVFWQFLPEKRLKSRVGSKIVRKVVESDRGLMLPSLS